MPRLERLCRKRPRPRRATAFEELSSGRYNLKKNSSSFLIVERSRTTNLRRNDRETRNPFRTDSNNLCRRNNDVSYRRSATDRRILAALRAFLRLPNLHFRPFAFSENQNFFFSRNFPIRRNELEPIFSTDERNVRADAPPLHRPPKRAESILRRRLNEKVSVKKHFCPSISVVRIRKRTEALENCPLMPEELPLSESLSDPPAASAPSQAKIQIKIESKTRWKPSIAVPRSTYIRLSPSSKIRSNRKTTLSTIDRSTYPVFSSKSLKTIPKFSFPEEKNAFFTFFRGEFHLSAHSGTDLVLVVSFDIVVAFVRRAHGRSHLVAALKNRSVDVEEEISPLCLSLSAVSLRLVRPSASSLSPHFPPFPFRQPRLFLRRFPTAFSDFDRFLRPDRSN